MLYPISNQHRSVIDASGLWKFRIDPNGVGEQERWYEGFSSDLDIAVPGSWNEQLEEEGLLNYVGAAWYIRRIFIPSEWDGRSVWIRIGSADYHATVWVNGRKAGENHLGFLPFAFDVTQFIRPGEEALLVVRVSNQLADDDIPQGISAAHYERENRLREETFPPARFDFSPFGGIHRPVWLVALPPTHIRGIRVETSIQGTSGIIAVAVRSACAEGCSVRARLTGEGEPAMASVTDDAADASLQLTVNACRFWSPDDPHLYSLTVELHRDGRIIDEYTLPVGVREVRLTDEGLMLNGKRMYLTGFGRHEDSCVNGKGLNLPLMVKDFTLMKWINANSFRTSHYPYAEEVMQYADRKGFLVIDEVPAVSLDFRFVTDRTLTVHKEYVRRLMERDHNHPCVIMWALGNEPNLVGEPSYYDGRGARYWADVFAVATSLDPTRPKTVPNCLRAGICDPVFALSDVAAINRYYGWYEYPGRLAFGVDKLEEEIDAIRQRYKKPMMMTEFGVDTMPGLHSTTDQMFTEEYQSRYLAAYIKVLRSKPFMIGEHVWNFADFRTPQNLRRMVLNLKGVFSRTRAPKAAAFHLRELWNHSQTT